MGLFDVVVGRRLSAVANGGLERMVEDCKEAHGCSPILAIANVVKNVK